MLPLKTITTQKNMEFETDWEEMEKDLFICRVRMHTEQPCVFLPVVLQFTVPAIEAHYIWTPKIDLIRALNPSWYENLYTSNAFTGAPVNSIMRYDDINICTWAYSDTFETAVLRSWAIEETGMYECSIRLFENENDGILRQDYQEEIRIDRRPIRYDEALGQVQKWWCTRMRNKPHEIPEAAYHAMYSTWYSYHQNLKQQPLLEECAKAKKLGCNTIILDDGWQTDDNKRGYAYCGDWKPCREKIPDMQKFVSLVHSLDMKVMLWYSVPYIGVKSNNFKRFKDKILCFVKPEWAVLDIRYPDVRDFIISTYESAVKDWDLDGFKLDFIDDFVVMEAEDMRPRSGMDCCDMLRAADRLFTDLGKRMRDLKKDILIEFRQTFNGPAARHYSNMLRAVDAPADSDENRVRIANIRLLAGNTAVHSDMIMWNYDDTVESAAMQIANILFGVPQISVRLGEIREDHAEMLHFYMGLWNHYRDLFLHGAFQAELPRAHFIMLSAKLGNQFAASVHGKEIVDIPETCGEGIIVIASYMKKMYIHLSGKYTIQRYSCRGLLQETLEAPAGDVRVSVNPADVLFLTKSDGIC